MLRLKSGIILTALAVSLASLVLTLVLPSPALGADVNGDFALDMKVNGQDMFASQAFSITPDETLVFNLYIHDIQKQVEMQRLSVEIFFAGVPVSTITQELGRVINPGETYRPDIPPVSARDYLSIWGVNIATGKYKAIVKLEYTALGQIKTWTQSREVNVPGNPMTTVAGVAAAIVTGIALGGVIALLKSLAGYSLEAQALTGRKSIEARARSNISGSLVAAVKKIVVKDRCPLCGEAIKHGFCRTCRKPVRELQRTYRRRIHDLSAAGIKLLADGEVKSMGELPQRLGIEGRMATDVTATIRNARLFQIKRVGRSLLASVLLAGISSAVASVLWITIGGLAVLSTAALMTILVLAILVPFVIARALQIKMRRQLDRLPDAPSCQTPASN